MSVATGTALALGVAAASAGAGVYAAHKQASTAKEAAALQSASADKATAASDKANTAALDFQKQQAAEDKARYEAAQRANYNQYLAKYAAVKALGGAGLNLPDAPAYDAATGGPAGAGSAGASSADPKAVAFIRDWQAKNAPTATPADLVQAAAAAGITGITPYLYGQTPSNNEVSIGGQKFKIKGGEEGPNPTWYYGGDDSAPGAGRLSASMPSGGGAYLPSSIGSYLPPAVGDLQPIALQRPQAFRLGPRTGGV